MARDWSKFFRKTDKLVRFTKSIKWILSYGSTLWHIWPIQEQNCPTEPFPQDSCQKGIIYKAYYTTIDNLLILQKQIGIVMNAAVANVSNTIAPTRYNHSFIKRNYFGAKLLYWENVICIKITPCMVLFDTTLKEMMYFSLSLQYKSRIWRDCRSGSLPMAAERDRQISLTSRSETTYTTTLYVQIFQTTDRSFTDWI